MFNSDLPADSSKIRFSAGYIRDNFKALETALGPGLTVFPTGTKLWFYQDTAPSGWSIVTSLSDCLLGVKNTEDDEIFSTAGEVAGTWQLPDHVLTVNQLPSHNHRIVVARADGYNARLVSKPPSTSYGDTSDARVYPYTDNAGGNEPHNHGDEWRPMTAVGIIAERS